MKLLRGVGARLRRWFLSGLVVVVPLVVTYLVLKFVFESVDGILGPLVVTLHGKPVPGLGLLATLVLVLLVGSITAGVVGNRLLRFWESLMARIPLIRLVYGGARQVVESVSRQGGTSFQQVGLLEYPRPGLYSLCFLANKLPVRQSGRTEERLAVFVPSTPTPFTGFLVLVKPEELILLDLSVEAAVKLVVSGGIVAPEYFTARPGKAG